MLYSAEKSSQRALFQREECWVVLLLSLALNMNSILTITLTEKRYPRLLASRVFQTLVSSLIGLLSLRPLLADRATLLFLEDLKVLSAAAEKLRSSGSGDGGLVFTDDFTGSWGETVMGVCWGEPRALRGFIDKSS